VGVEDVDVDNSNDDVVSDGDVLIFVSDMTLQTIYPH
jgi:hypothetical protein